MPITAPPDPGLEQGIRVPGSGLRAPRSLAAGYWVMAHFLAKKFQIFHNLQHILWRRRREHIALFRPRPQGHKIRLSLGSFGPFRLSFMSAMCVDQFHRTVERITHTPRVSAEGRWDFHRPHFSLNNSNDFRLGDFDIEAVASRANEAQPPRLYASLLAHLKSNFITQLLKARAEGGGRRASTYSHHLKARKKENSWRKMLHSSIRSSRSRSSSFERPLSHYCWKFYSTFVPPTQPLPLIVFVLFRPASFVLCPPRQLTSLRFRLQIFLITFLPRRVPFDFSEEAEAGETFPHSLDSALLFLLFLVFLPFPHLAGISSLSPGW